MFFSPSDITPASLSPTQPISQSVHTLSSVTGQGEKAERREDEMTKRKGKNVPLWRVPGTRSNRTHALSSQCSVFHPRPAAFQSLPFMLCCKYMQKINKELTH